MNDLQPVPWLPLDALDLPGLRALAYSLLPDLPDGLPADEAGLKTGLLARSGPHTVPTTTAALLFAKRPQLQQPNWGIGVARIRGLTLSDEIEARDDLEGNVASLVEKVLHFVHENTRHIAAEPPQGSPSEYPDVAIREIVLNALLHRDLRAGGRVLIRLYLDRMEVWSPGGLPPPLTDLEELLQEGGVSNPRNVMLAGTARRLGLGEQMGRGLTLARRAVARLSRQQIEISSSQAEVRVVIPSSLQAPATLS
jgi:predicted HTH transcriptional regulator